MFTPSRRRSDRSGRRDARARNLEQASEGRPFRKVARSLPSGDPGRTTSPEGQEQDQFSSIKQTQWEKRALIRSALGGLDPMSPLHPPLRGARSLRRDGAHPKVGERATHALSVGGRPAGATTDAVPLEGLETQSPPARPRGRPQNARILGLLRVTWMARDDPVSRQVKSK